MTPPRDLLTVWNPSYAEDAMDRHLQVYLRWAKRWREGEAEAADVYVWWPKLRSPRREDPLPHAEEVLSLQEQIDDGVETHLYPLRLCDFQPVATCAHGFCQLNVLSAAVNLPI